MNKIIDFFFPKCNVFYWGNYIKTKRIFILKYWWNNRWNNRG